MALRVVNSSPNDLAIYGSLQGQPMAYPSAVAYNEPAPSYGGGGYTTEYSSGGGGGGYSAPAPPAPPQIDYAAVAAFDQGIGQTDAAMGRLGTQQGIGDENIINAYNSSLNTLLQGKATAERDYTNTRTQSTKDNLTAKSNIDTRTGQRANSLQKLLGSRGAGSSSAARVAAPYAAAKEGTQARSQVTDAFGRNMQALDTNWGDYYRKYEGGLKDAWDQRFSKHNELAANIGEKRASLLQQLAQLKSQRALAAGGDASASVAAAQPYLNQVNAIGQQVDQLGRQFNTPINVNAPTYATPNLAQYNYDRLQAAEVGGGAMSDTINPNYLSVLLGKKDDRLTQGGIA